MPERKKKPSTTRRAASKPTTPKATTPARKRVPAASTKTKGAKRTAPAANAPPPDAAREFAIEAARMLHDDKCTDVVLLDVRGKSQVTNYIVIGSGTSDRQMRSVLQHVEDLGKARGFTPWRTDKDVDGRWLLLDCVDVVTHLFEPNTRSHYDLEMLWGDAPRVEWERADQRPRDRANLGA
ncbi:MAG: hypothetical protein HBSAPP03_22940 [Phycisphaerae bacterium]|nr:MAG: hypothetical protein HBSAPP03_22940 [Phycisphaerae bacterium]